MRAGQVVRLDSPTGYLLTATGRVENGCRMRVVRRTPGGAYDCRVREGVKRPVVIEGVPAHWLTAVVEEVGA